MSLKQYAEREVRRRMKCVTRLPSRAVSTTVSALDNTLVSVSRADVNLRKAGAFVAQSVENALDSACCVSSFADSLVPRWYDPWDEEAFEEWS